MELQHKTTGCRVVGVGRASTPSCWQLRPVEYRVDREGVPRYATAPEGAWFPKATWSRVV